MIGSPAIVVTVALGLLVLAPPPGCADDRETPTPTRPAEMMLLPWSVWWDDGIRFERWQRFSFGDAALAAERPFLNGRVGVKVQVDGAAFREQGLQTPVDDGIELRRAYLYAEGELAWPFPLLFKLELGVTNDSLFLDDAFITLPAIPYVGSLTLGQFKPPFSFEQLTGAWDTVLMERAPPVEAFAPGSKAGFVFRNQAFEDRLTWALGWFADGTAVDEGDASSSLSRVAGRLTGIVWEGAGEGPPRLLHVGLSASYVFSPEESIRYRARPGSHQAPVLVDTGTIEARDAGLVSLEAAFIRGPFSVFGEILGSAVETTGADLLTFGGGYVTATWMLTGESRPYDRRTGVFTRVVPRREVSFHEGGGGAWEWSLRWAYVDLNDGDVRGGRMGLWSTGISWYLTRSVRAMAEYGFARVEGGDLHTLQARVAFRF